MTPTPHSPIAGLIRAALLILVVAALTAVFTRTIWSGSVDLAHHYALVARLAEHGNAPFPFDPSLAEMNFYPRLGHQMAASVGHWYASPLMGMQALAALSLALVWAGLAWLITSLPQRMVAITAAALAALLAANHYLLHMPLYGDELVGNFFFPQLLGQTLCIAVILVSLYLEKKNAAAWLRYALLVPAVYLLTGVHLLPALILLAMMGCMACSDLLLQWRRKRPGLAVAAALRAGLLLCALAALVSHPGFAAMRSISAQNGGLALAHLDSMAALATYSAVIGLMSVALLAYWARRQDEARFTALKYVGLYGVAVSILCLAQGAALAFGFGSEYAVRKYVFSLDTVVLIELALLPSLLLLRKAKAGAAAGGWFAKLQYVLLPAALTLLACLTITAQPVVYKTRQLVALERTVAALRPRLEGGGAGKFSYVIGTDGATPIVEYMMSIGQLRMSRMDNTDATSLLYQDALSNWAMVGGIVTAENGSFDRVPDCRLGAPLAGLVALDGGCLLRHSSGAARIDFTEANHVFPCTLSGFSSREVGGTWISSSLATLRCPLVQVNGRAPGRVEISASAFQGEVASQHVVLTADGGVPLHGAFGGPGNQTQSLSLPLDAYAGRELVVQFALPDAVSPQQLGLSGDARKLSLFVHAIEFKD